MMRKNENKNEVLEWIKVIAIVFVFAWAIRMFIFTPIDVQGASMMPTYEDGDRIIVNKIGTKISDYEHFDVIVFEATEDTNYIKRVIGLPGAHIAYKDDVLHINGEPYDEQYLEEYKAELKDSGTLTEDFTLEQYTGETTIPKGYLFVLGDNRRKSSDSRDARVGLISMEKVLGTTSIVFWPLNNVGIIK